MFFRCDPTCTNPNHRHAKRSGYAAAKQSVIKASTSKLARAVRKKGSPLRIDLHCHYLNPAVHQKVSHLNQGAHEFAVIFANDHSRQVNVKQHHDRAGMLSDIDVRLKDMDKMGIDVQAVSPAPSQYYYWAEAGFAAELHREVNDRIAEIVATHPDRFVGLANVPLQNADLAVKELERAVKQLGLKGAEICTNVNGKDLTDPSLGLEKFFRKAQELDVVLFMHPNGYSQADRFKDHYFNNVIGNPLDTTVAVHHLIFDGFMERMPKLKIVLAHSGGYVGHYFARMDHAWRARPDSRTMIKKKPTSHLAKFWFDTITFDTEMLKRTIDKWGADHIVLGTDYPYDMGMYDPLGHIDAVPRLSRQDKDRIMGGNAAKLLKIKPTR